GLPALFVLYIRWNAKEPPRWERVSEAVTRISFAQFIARTLQPAYRRRAIANVFLLCGALMGFLAGARDTGVALQTLAKAQGYAAVDAARLASWGLAALSTCTIAGCLLVPRMVDLLGRRNALSVLFIAMFIGIAGAFGWAFPHNDLQ